MIATTIEQSKHLLELGLDPKTADCNWNTTYGEWALCVGKNNLPHAVPAWSLEALLKVMPKTIVIDNQNSDVDDIYVLSIEYTGDDNEPEISYMDYTSTFIHSVGGEDELTAVYKMVCWLLENNLIKKGGQDD